MVAQNRTRLKMWFTERLLNTYPDSVDWHLLLEFEIPRRQKRPDVILLAQDVVFVIEFKVGATSFQSSDRWQTEEYALDLRDFHSGSQNRRLVPILCATKAPSAHPVRGEKEALVWPLNTTNAAELPAAVCDLYGAATDSSRAAIVPSEWASSDYRPTLTIIEAAEALFSGHTVREISHCYADNLTETTRALVRTIEAAQASDQRVICLVTGVPGAGKTLTGLNAVHDPALRARGRPPGVFLSGNGPLVKIVREALVRSKRSQGADAADATREVRTFIQNVHGFIRHYTADQTPPPLEHVIVFDEAQRAWDADQMRRKHGIPRSEPELVLDIMARCPQWSVIIALVGGGQEIHQGEAGLAEWGRALLRAKCPWLVVASSEALSGGTSVAGQRLFPNGVPADIDLSIDDSLHLRVNVRSPRALQISEWVNDFLEMRAGLPHSGMVHMNEFPLMLTRDLGRAREWLRRRSRLDPYNRCGLLSSSGAIRHRAHGLELSTGFRSAYPFSQWFLGGVDDVRSSYALEVAATEFECQGLELDWVGLCWGDDLCVGPDGGWLFRRFSGSRWVEVRDPIRQRYLLNKYRVLLTRARKGLVIWIPAGDSSDRTRSPGLLDATYKYLLDSGIPELGAP